VIGGQLANAIARLRLRKKRRIIEGTFLGTNGFGSLHDDRHIADRLTLYFTR
jgi:hypothetical protein